MRSEQDVVRKRRVLMAAVQTTMTTVRAWDGRRTTTDVPSADSKAPLARFSIIEPVDVFEAESKPVLKFMTKRNASAQWVPGALDTGAKANRTPVWPFLGAGHQAFPNRTGHFWRIPFAAQLIKRRGSRSGRFGSSHITLRLTAIPFA